MAQLFLLFYFEMPKTVPNRPEGPQRPMGPVVPANMNFHVKSPYFLQRIIKMLKVAYYTVMTTQPYNGLQKK